MANLHVKIEDGLQTLPLLGLDEFRNGDVDGFNRQTRVDDDHREDADGCGAKARHTTVNRSGLNPYGHGVARLVLLSVVERVFDDWRGDRERHVDRFPGEQNAGGRGTEGEVPVDWIGRDAGGQRERRRSVAVVLDLDLKRSWATGRQRFCIAVHRDRALVGFPGQHGG